jgi:hypothetical protein
MRPTFSRFVFAAVRCLCVLDVTLLQRLPPNWRAGLIEAAAWLRARVQRRPRVAINEVGKPYGSMVPRSGTVKALPDWIEREIEGLRRDVDPLLYRNGAPVTSRYQYWYPTRFEAGLAYNRLLRQIPRNPARFFLVPDARMAGPSFRREELDRAFNLPNEPNSAVVITGCDRFASATPERAEILHVGEVAAHLSEHERHVIVSRLLIQCAPAEICLTNSAFSLQLLAGFGRSIRGAARIICRIEEPPGGLDGPCLEALLPNVDPFITFYILPDAAPLAPLMVAQGIDASRLKVARLAAAAAPADGHALRRRTMHRAAP